MKQARLLISTSRLQAPLSSSRRILTEQLAATSLLALLLIGQIPASPALAEAPPPIEAPIQATIGDFQQAARATFAPAVPSISTIGGAWQSQGPGLALNGQVEGIAGPNPVCGAVSRVAPHPTNANILYAGAVNGGVWRTTNATAVAPTWTPLTDQLASPSIGALEFDPTDASNQTLVAGIGRLSSFGGVGGALTGIQRTTDGGNSWTELGQAQLSGLTAYAVAPRGNTILVGTNGGLYRSVDGGASFLNVSGTAGLNVGTVFDLARDPGNNLRVYAAVAGSSGGVFRSGDAGATWTNVTNPAIAALAGGARNMKLSVSAATGNAVFVGLVDGSRRLAGVFRSGNQGGAWTAMDLPQTTEGGVTVGIHPGAQGHLHFSLLADPTNGNIVYVGGDRQERPFPNSISANNYSGRLFRGNASVAPTGGVPSPQWTPLTNSGTSSNSSPHADSRDMEFDAGGNIIEVDDGGIYRRTNPRTNAGDWFSVIGTLQVTQFHSIAYDGNFNVILGGSQDTGSPYQTSAGSSSWTDLSQGDGGDVAVDNTSIAGQSISYWSSQNLFGFRRRTCTGANACGGATLIGLTVTSGNPVTPWFLTPIELNSQDPTRLIIGAANGVYESADRGANITQLNSLGMTSGGMVYGHPTNPELIVVGQGPNVLVRTTAGGALTATASAPPTTGNITDIAVDPANANVMFVTTLGSVARTTDGGTTWTDITGSLGGPSGSNFRTVAYVEGIHGIDFLVVGAAKGTFVLPEPFCDCWSKLGTGLPNAPVWDLDYDPADDVLVAGTQGRSAWTLGGVAGILPPGGTDVVFLFDVTGSTGALLPQWKTQIPSIVAAWQAADPNVRFGLASHVDFPFDPYGSPGEWAYRVESPLDPNVTALTAALGNLTNQFGNDTPESQYEAIYQVLTGAGRDLVDPVNYTDPGEYPPVSIGQQRRMVIYHFTYPEVFHDRDLEPDYPFLGSKAVAGRTAVLNELKARSGTTMFVGLTFITGAATSGAQGESQASGPAATASALNGVGPLAEMAAITGGAVYNVGTDLEGLLAAIDSSIVRYEDIQQSNQSPDCTNALPSEQILWPQTHGFHPISIEGVTDPDGDPVTITVTGVTQDEPVKSGGDGNTCPDAQVVDGQASLRVERAGTPGLPGNGRVYTISFIADDGRGGRCSGSVQVCVPHDNRTSGCVDDGLRYASTDCPAGGVVRAAVAGEFNLNVAALGGKEATIEFALATDTHVKVTVFDVVGRRLATVEDAHLAAGTYQRSWDLAGVSNGLYFVRMNAGPVTITKRVLNVH